MFESLNDVDWNLLHRQKLTLLKLRQHWSGGSAEAEALSGVIHLLDALQDDAVVIGRWAFPGEPDNSPTSEPPAPEPVPAPEAPVRPATQQTEKLWRYIYRGWRGRRR